VLNKRISTGPSTVLRVIEHPEMASAVTKIVRRLQLSGIHGFDFMLESQTDHAYMIEINPRSTQVGHLTLGPGRDLPAALFASVSGTKIQEAPALTDKSVIALFPQEWLRNPTSSLLRTGYHDVPWKEPELIRSCFRRAGNRNDWYAQNKAMKTLLEVKHR
jgi:hypothetical protein